MAQLLPAITYSPAVELRDLVLRGSVLPGIRPRDVARSGRALTSVQVFEKLLPAIKAHPPDVEGVDGNSLPLLLPVLVYGSGIIGNCQRLEASPLL